MTMKSDADSKTNDDEDLLKESILSTLRGSKDGSSMKVKELQKCVLLSVFQSDDTKGDKTQKKQFKKSVKSLEGDKHISLDADGNVKLLESGKKKKQDKEEKKKKKKKRKKEERTEEEGISAEEGDVIDGDSRSKRSKPLSSQEEGGDEHVDDNNGGQQEEQQQQPQKKKAVPCKGNPNGTTRLFMGNLPFAVNDESLGEYLQPAGVLTHVKWITDKETGRFYGSAFVEMETSTCASNAVNDMNGTELMGRKIKINYAPSRPGDIWPPKSRTTTGGSAGNDGGGKKGDSKTGAKGLQSPKPEDCTKLFVGNVAFEIDDDVIMKFFENGTSNDGKSGKVEVKAIRWLHHKDTGDFKGCGFVEFWNTDACERAAALNGKSLLGRPIRIDWTD